MCRKTVCSVLIIAGLLVLIPTLAMAIDMEYITYGGLNSLQTSFTNMAQIFANNSYKALFFTLAVAGIFITGASFYLKQISGQNVGAPHAWLIPAVIGMVIYLALVVPKGKLTIYDEVLNRHTEVTGIPDGIIIVVGLLNKIETGMVDIVNGSTVTGVYDYHKHAGGTGLLGLQDLASLPLTAVGSYIDQSVRNYIDDCVSPALTDNTSGLSTNSLRQKNVSKDALELAANPALYTTYYGSADSAGSPLTCQASWVLIKADLSADNISKKALNSACSLMGFDIGESSQITTCKDRLNDIITSSRLGNMASSTVETFVMQKYLANRLEEVYRSGDTTAASNYGFMMQASGVMQQANQWIPTMKAAMTAIAVGLIPFLALFIPTPLFGRGIGLMLGFFVWLTCWGVTDAIIHSYIIDFSGQLFDQLNQERMGALSTEIGMDALYFYPTSTAKSLAMFGTLRMSGMMLATVISGALVKFGGSAMAHMAGGLTGQFQSTGASGQLKTQDPSSVVSEVSRLRSETIPGQGWINTYSAPQASAAAGVAKLATTQAGLNMLQNFGHTGSVDRGAAAIEKRQIEGGAWKRAAESLPKGVHQADSTSQFGAETNLRTTGKQQETFGTAEAAAVSTQVNNFEPGKASADQTIATAAQNNMTTQQQANVVAAASIPKTVQNALSSGGGTGWTAHEAQSLSNTFKSMGPSSLLSDEQYAGIAKQHHISGGAQGAKMLHAAWLGNKAGTSQEGEKAFVNRMSGEGFASKPETQKDIAAAAAQTAKTVGGAEGDSTRGGAEQIEAAGPDAAYNHGKVSKAAELATAQQASNQDASEFARQNLGISLDDRRYYDANGGLTEYATHKMALSKAGANLSEYAHGDGTSKGTRDADGNLIKGSASGTIAASNPQAFDALVGTLASQGYGKLANYLKSSGLRGKAMDYRLNFDKDGKVSSIDIGRDAKGHYTERYDSKTGRTIEKTDNKVQIYSSRTETGIFNTNGTGGTLNVGVQSATVKNPSTGQPESVQVAGNVWTGKDGAPVGGDASGSLGLKGVVTTEYAPNTGQKHSVMAPEGAPVAVGYRVSDLNVDGKGHVLRGSKQELGITSDKIISTTTSPGGSEKPIVLDAVKDESGRIITQKGQGGTQINVENSWTGGTNVKETSTTAGAVELVTGDDKSITKGGTTISKATETTARGENALKEGAEKKGQIQQILSPVGGAQKPTSGSTTPGPTKPEGPKQYLGI